MPKEVWKSIEKDLINNYGFTKKEIGERGFISFDFGDIIDDYSSYWEQPDLSFYKENNKILKNVIEIKKENELNQDTINWINTELYPKKEKEEKLEI